MTAFEVGQKVIIESRFIGGNRRQTADGEVVKVARKYATVVQVPHGNERRFELDTGWEYSPGGYTPHARIFTPEQLQERDERRDLLERLKAGGLRFDYGQRESAFSLDKLAALVAIVEAD